MITVYIKPGTPLYPLDEHGLADHTRGPMTDLDGSENVPVIGQYGRYAIVKHADDEYAVALNSLGYFDATRVLEPPSLTSMPLVELERTAKESLEAWDRSGLHAVPSDEPDEYGIIPADFLPKGAA
jgi:hypothetical protein